MKVTVAIPTVAGRSRYLASSIATCISQNSDDFEIIVSDNSNRDAEDVVKSFSDPRIRYIRPPSFLVMSAHWDFVLQNATGDYVSIIGDDDGLMPDCIERVQEIHRLEGLVPIHHSLCNYFWPDHPRVERRNTVQFFHGFNEPSSMKISQKFLKGCCAGTERYADGPMVYHNFIPTSLIRTISGAGPFFRRPIPDVYSSLAIAANTREFYSSGEYLTISGQGARSNGALVSIGGSDGTTFAASKTSDILLRPRFSSRTVPMLLVDSMLEVSEQFKNSLAISDINYPCFLEAAVSEALQMRSVLAKVRELSDFARLAKKEHVLAELAYRLLKRAAKKAAKIIKGSSRLEEQTFIPHDSELKLDKEVVDIAGAAEAVTKYLASRSHLTT